MGARQKGGGTLHKTEDGNPGALVKKREESK